MEHNKQLHALQESLRTKQAEAERAQAQLAQLKNHFEEEMAAVEDKQQLELRRVDEKVRGLFRAKDETIEGLRAQLGVAQRAAEEAEALLRHLHSAVR